MIRFKRLGVFTYFIRIAVIIKLLLTNNFDYFLCSGKFSLWLIWFQKIFAVSASTFCILHGSEVNLKNKFLRKFTHTSISRFGKIISVSRFTQSLLPDSILKMHEKHFIIPNGLDFRDYVLNVNVKLQGDPILLTVGHVTPRKGQHRLIRALPDLIKKFPNIQYHIVGQPVYKTEFQNLAIQLGVENHIEFHGSVKVHSMLWSYYNAADVFVLLSENQSDGDVEGFGIVALEANLMGKPVVGAKYCGVEDAVNNYQSGVLVDGDDTSEIIKAVEFCIENKVVLASKCKDWALLHDWDLVGKRFRELL